MVKKVFFGGSKSGPKNDQKSPFSTGPILTLWRSSLGRGKNRYPNFFKNFLKSFEKFEKILKFVKIFQKFVKISSTFLMSEKRFPWTPLSLQYH